MKTIANILFVLSLVILASCTPATPTTTDDATSSSPSSSSTSSTSNAQSSTQSSVQQSSGLSSVASSVPSVASIASVASISSESSDAGLTMSVVAQHNTKASCYTVVDGLVYDITSYIPFHPGGERDIMKACGRDATSMFHSKHDSKPQAADELSKLQIGILAQ